MVVDDAGDLHLVHRKHHSRRTARRGQDGADVRNVAYLCACSSELLRNKHSKQASTAQFVECLSWKTRITIHRIRESPCNFSGRFSMANELERGRGAQIAIVEQGIQ